MKLMSAGIRGGRKGGMEDQRNVPEFVHAGNAATATPKVWTHQ